MKNNKMQVCPGCSVNTWDRLSLASGTTAALSVPLARRALGTVGTSRGHQEQQLFLQEVYLQVSQLQEQLGSIWRTGEAGGAKPESRLTCLVGGVLEPRNPGALKESDL